MTSCDIIIGILKKFNNRLIDSNPKHTTGSNALVITTVSFNQTDG